MTCFFCKGTMHESTTPHVVDLKECLIIVRNVPCLECETCGETAFTHSVAQHLKRIVQTYRKLATKITVVNYTENVA